MEGTLISQSRIVGLGFDYCGLSDLRQDRSVLWASVSLLQSECVWGISSLRFLIAPKFYDIGDNIKNNLMDPPSKFLSCYSILQEPSRSINREDE